MGPRDLFDFKAAKATVKAAQQDVKKKPGKVVKLSDHQAKKSGGKK